MKPIYAFYLIAALAAAVAVTGCNGADGRTANGETAPAERITRVETMVVAPQRFDEVVRLTGTVEATSDAVISAETGGQVQQLQPLGAFVNRGAVVARFDDRLQQSAYNAARAAYELAEDTYRRQEALHRDEIISTLEFESTRTQRDQARAQMEQARKQLDDARLTAPISGRIEERYVQVGELVNPGSPVARIVNTSTVKIVAGIPELYAADIRTGTEVEIDLRAYNGNRRLGRVTFVGNVINPSSRTFPVEVEIPNPDQQLKPEMVADLSIIRRTVTDAIVVPRNAVVRDERGHAVFVVQSVDGRDLVTRRDVSVGASYGDRTVVQRGLEADEIVVIVGQNNITEGDRVEVARQHAPSAVVGGPGVVEHVPPTSQDDTPHEIQ